MAVRLGDTNGPRGGMDKFCRMQVYFKNAPPVFIEEIGADLYAVIDRAAERAGRNVAKRVDRLYEKYSAGNAAAACLAVGRGVRWVP